MLSIRPVFVIVVLVVVRLKIQKVTVTMVPSRQKCGEIHILKEESPELLFDF